MTRPLHDPALAGALRALPEDAPANDPVVPDGADVRRRCDRLAGLGHARIHDLAAGGWRIGYTRTARGTDALRAHDRRLVVAHRGLFATLLAAPGVIAAQRHPDLSALAAAGLVETPERAARLTADGTRRAREALRDLEQLRGALRGPADVYRALDAGRISHDEALALLTELPAAAPARVRRAFRALAARGAAA